MGYFRNIINLYEKKLLYRMCIIIFVAVVYNIYSLIFIFKKMPNELTYPDTACYKYMSGISIFSKDFIFGIKPFVIPLLWKIVNIINIDIVHFQCIFLLLCINITALILFKLYQNLYIYFVILLSFFSWHILGWERVLYSEGILFALLFLWLGSYILFFKKESISSFVFLLFTSFILSFARDSNIYFLICISLMNLLMVVFFIKNLKKKLKLNVLFTIFIIIIFIFESYSIKKGKRYQFPLINVLLQRIIPNDNYRKWFVNRGMPQELELLMLSGKWASSENRKVYTLIDFIKWTENYGQTTYLKFLLTHPLYTIKKFH